MGWWQSERGLLGDAAADVMGAALREIASVYLRDAGRVPSQGEIADLIEFCTSGVVRAEVRDWHYPFDMTTAGEQSTPRMRMRGMQGALAFPPPGDQSPCGGFLANVDPTTGRHLLAPRANVR